MTASAPGVEPDAVSRAAADADPTDPFRVWLRFLGLDQRLRLTMSRRLRDAGLSIPQFDVLSALAESEGMTQRDLARHLFVTKGNVSGLIDRLVEAGLVERRRGAKDRRAHALFLTAQGRHLAQAGFAVQSRFVGETLGRLPPADLATLNLLLGRWREAARAASDVDAAPGGD